ncbi:hypothetical protein [Pseudomonas sp. TH10]|jgi:hypothetical protein|uniref:hypothetical protein n=1 Tax=Pseudomonas sp. TH10 TaxID=2796376 RepID=UPI0019146E2F|nr:hypothetical protein [Pseudomonas sp. TH10]MBK5519763.1 hypothetical protein [Pseudomonas sp. TH10]
MQADEIVEHEKHQEIARALGFLTVGDLAVLADVKISTLEAWRKRKQGPQHIQFGNNPLYPIFEVKRFLEALYSKGQEVSGSRRHVSDAL